MPLPKSFSATALQTAEACMARYHVETIMRTKGVAGTAASLGSSVHGGLEMYVQQYMKTGTPPPLKDLIDFFRMSYMVTFGVSEAKGDLYDEGVIMLKAWFKRMDGTWDDFEVVSCEVKENFPVKTSVGEIPLNFIWDRHDKLDEGVYRVVDYKTNKWGINPGDLKNKIQARVYGLAAQIKYPDATRIWVEFDMLRHEGPVAIVFTREDNIATWGFIKRKAESIIEAQAGLEARMGAGETLREALRPMEKLNGECLFCPRKLECGEVSKNIAIGGIMSGGNVLDMVDARAELEYQQKARASLMKELDAMILDSAKAEDRLEYETDDNRLNVGISARRKLDGDQAARILGPVLFDKYGGKTLSVTTVDKLLKGDELTDEQKAEIQSLIYFEKGEPRVKITPKNPIDGD